MLNCRRATSDGAGVPSKSARKLIAVVTVIKTHSTAKYRLEWGDIHRIVMNGLPLWSTGDGACVFGISWALDLAAQGVMDRLPTTSGGLVMCHWK